MEEEIWSGSSSIWGICLFFGLPILLTAIMVFDRNGEIVSIRKESQPCCVTGLRGDLDNSVFKSEDNVVFFIKCKEPNCKREVELKRVSIVQDSKNCVEEYNADVCIIRRICRSKYKIRRKVYEIHVKNKPKEVSDKILNSLRVEGTTVVWDKPHEEELKSEEDFIKKDFE